MFVKMEDAILVHNLDNMKWIKERYNGSIFWQDDICVEMAIGNLGIMKWLHGKDTFQLAAKQGDIKTMEWLYKKKCPWSIDTFHWAIANSDLETMVWLFEKDCPWDDFLFFWQLSMVTLISWNGYKENDALSTILVFAAQLMMVTLITWNG